MGEATIGSSTNDPKDQKTEQFLQLLGAHERSLFTYIFALSPKWQDAEEIMQRVRIRIWQQFDQYESDKPFEPWARAIAYYLVLAYRKDKGRQREVFAERVLEEISERFNAFADEANTRRDALLGCLDRLDGQKRELVQSYYLEREAPATALAEKFSMTPNALRQALFRVRKLLFDCVERTLRGESSGAGA